MAENAVSTTKTPIETNSDLIAEVQAMVNNLPEAGGGTTEVWELIKSIETTEEVSGVTITTDLSGNAFSLKKCRVEGIFPVGAGNGLWYFYLSPDTQFFGTSAWGNGNNPSVLKIDADMTTKPAYALGFRRRPDLTLEAVWIERKSLDYESITAVRILNFSELTLPIGSKITVWGIKA